MVQYFCILHSSRYSLAYTYNRKVKNFLQYKHKRTSPGYKRALCRDRIILEKIMQLATVIYLRFLVCAADSITYT